MKNLVKSFRLRVETGFDVAKSISPSQLSKCHANQLLSNSKVLDLGLGVVFADQTGESLPVNKIEDLR